MNFILSRIQNKMIAAFLIVLLIPLLSYIYTYISTNTSVTEIVIDYELNELVLSLKTLRYHLQSGINDIQYFSESGDLLRLLRSRRTGTDEEQENALAAIEEDWKRLVRNENMYHHISYIDESGREFFRLNNENSQLVTAGASELQNQSRSDFYKEAMKLKEGEWYVSNIHLLIENGKIFEPFQPVMNYAAPVFYSNGDRAGVILIAANADILFEGMASAGHDEQGTVCLVDKDGYFLAHPDSTQLWGKDLETGVNLNKSISKKKLQEILAEKNGYTFTDKNLVCHALFMLPGKSSTYWKLINIIDKDELTKPIASIRNLFVVALIVGVIIAVSVALYLARGISGPVLHLTQVANRISRGELDVEVKTKSRDEIGQLAESINRMRTSLEAAIIRLRKHR